MMQRRHIFNLACSIELPDRDEFEQKEWNNLIQRIEGASKKGSELG